MYPAAATVQLLGPREPHTAPQCGATTAATLASASSTGAEPLPQLTPPGPPLCFQAEGTRTQAVGVSRGRRVGRSRQPGPRPPRTTRSRLGCGLRGLSAPTLPRWDVAPNPPARDIQPPHPLRAPSSSSITPSGPTGPTLAGSGHRGPVARCTVLAWLWGSDQPWCLCGQSSRTASHIGSGTSPRPQTSVVLT